MALAWLLCFRVLAWVDWHFHAASLASFNCNRAASHNQHWLGWNLPFSKMPVSSYFANTPNWVSSTEVCIMQQFLIVLRAEAQPKPGEWKGRTEPHLTLISVKANHRNWFSHWTKIHWVLLLAQPHRMQLECNDSLWDGSRSSSSKAFAFSSPYPSCLGETWWSCLHAKVPGLVPERRVISIQD